MNSIVGISKILLVSKPSLLWPNSKIFVIDESLYLEMVPLDLSCAIGFSLHNNDWDSEGGSESLFQYPDGNNTLGIHSSESCVWICD